MNMLKWSISVHFEAFFARHVLQLKKNAPARQHLKKTRGRVAQCCTCSAVDDEHQQDATAP